jgi:hypothetical protein
MNWTKSDAVALRDYLGTVSGVKFLPFLKLNKTKVTAASFESVALEAKEAKGEDNMLELIESMAKDQPETQIDPGFVNTDV